MENLMNVNRNLSIFDDDMINSEHVVTSQMFALGMYLEVEVKFDWSPSTFGNCDHIEITEVWALGHYPEGHMSDAAERGDYAPLNIKIDLDYVTDDEMKILMNFARAEVKDIRKGERDF